MYEIGLSLSSSSSRPPNLLQLVRGEMIYYKDLTDKGKRKSAELGDEMNEIHDGGDELRQRTDALEGDVVNRLAAAVRGRGTTQEGFAPHIVFRASKRWRGLAIALASP